MKIRSISVQQVQEIVRKLLLHSAYKLPADYLNAMQVAREREISSLGVNIITMILDNADYAEAEKIPTCQDTGMAILHLSVGQNVHFTDGDLNQALHDAVAEAYQKLRKSVVSDPLLRQNSGDNTPPIIHYEIVPGDKVEITALMKGFGAELMSRLQMFPPSVGEEGIKEFVLETIQLAGPNACPPLIVGVGIGGSFDTVGYLAKRALMRTLGTPHQEAHIAQLEKDLLTAINALGIGPQGFGGSTTALAVHVECYATHIAALPVAVNLNCSAPRRATVTL